MDKLITFILVFSLSLIGQSLLAQENNVDNRIKVDSLIWSNDNTIPPYPHEAKLDSALKAQADVKNQHMKMIQQLAVFIHLNRHQRYISKMMKEID
jgi:hypothetical protein